MIGRAMPSETVAQMYVEGELAGDVGPNEPVAEGQVAAGDPVHEPGLECVDRSALEYLQVQLDHRGDVDRPGRAGSRGGGLLEGQLDLAGLRAVAGLEVDFGVGLEALRQFERRRGVGLTIEFAQSSMCSANSAWGRTCRCSSSSASSRGNPGPAGLRVVSEAGFPTSATPPLTA